jgi:hypothetical protein
VKQQDDILTFECIEAIDVGGSYAVDASGKPVRNRAASSDLRPKDPSTTTQNTTVADAAPGAAAELKAAVGGVPLASAEAPAAPAAQPKR